MTAHKKQLEEALVQRLQNGDQSVISEIYDNYSSTLYGVIFRIMQNEDEANDILQEAFINIWKYAKSYKANKSSLFTWMLNIARNKAIDAIRSKNRKNEIQSTEANVYIFENANPVENNTDTIGIKEAVDKLAADKKEVIELAYFGGYTQQEMADELNLPLGSVKTKVRAAMADLRKLFR